MLRLLLPPNLAAAAARNAIVVKAELDISAPPPTELLPALALIQRWCGGGRPPFFLQLSRAQLRELIALLHGQQVFSVVNRAGANRGRTTIAAILAPFGVLIRTLSSTI